MINEYMKMHFVNAIILRFSERVEAAGERRETVKSEDFDEESEIWARV